MEFFENDVSKKLEKEAERRKSNSLWVERYRPVGLDSFIGNAMVKEKAEQYIKENDIPHLLFFGRPGGGKTTLAKLLVHSINCDSMYINASAERGIDTVRDKIEGFASSVGFRSLKVIILDEADAITSHGQAALRNVMETFSQHTRFVLTCNYVEKIIEPIVSRTQVFELVPPSKKDIAIHINNILRRENVTATPGDIAFIINSFYPDIRRMINTFQMQTVDGKLQVNQKNMIDSDYKLKVIEILKDTKKEKRDAFKEIRQLIADNSVSHFEDAYKLLYDNIDEFAKGHIAPVILILAEMEQKASFVVDREINFVACIVQLLEEIRGK